MKKFILLTTFLLCVSAWAQETHSPKFKCTSVEDGEIKYLLIGNDFSHINNTNWENEVILASAEEYIGKYSPNTAYQFKIAPSEDGFLTHKNEISIGTNQKAKSYLLLDEAYELTYTLEIPFSQCEGLGTLDCFETKKYHCIKQAWVD